MRCLMSKVSTNRAICRVPQGGLLARVRRLGRKDDKPGMLNTTHVTGESVAQSGTRATCVAPVAYVPSRSICGINAAA